jgi:hypothetical protein
MSSLGFSNEIIGVFNSPPAIALLASVTTLLISGKLLEMSSMSCCTDARSCAAEPAAAPSASFAF